MLVTCNLLLVLPTGVMYGRWCSEKWDGQKLSEKPLFYQGVDDFTEGVLLGLSDEVQAVCRKVESLVSGFDLKDACTLHQWYLDSYKGQMADDSTLKLSMNTNSAYTGLTHPMKEVDGGFMPDLKYRYLAEDVPTGLMLYPRTRGASGSANAHHGQGRHKPTAKRIGDHSQGQYAGVAALGEKETETFPGMISTAPAS